MRPKSLANWKPFALLSLPLMASVYLTGCATLQEEFRASEAAKTALAQTSAKGALLPDLPAELRTCLLKQACQEEAAKAKMASRPAPECTTADGIVLAYVQSEREKRMCAQSMIKWYRQQQKIQEASMNMQKEGGHPRTTRPAEKATWP